MYRSLGILCFAILIGFSVHAEDKFKALPVLKEKMIRVEYGKKTSVLPLKLESGAEINKFLTVPAKDFYVIAYEFNVGPDGAAGVIMFDPKKLKELWRYPLDGFNLSEPFVDGNHVYLAVIGQVVKKDIATGKTIWEHKNLYDKYEFNGGEVISKKNGIIHFAENFAVNDSDGKIIPAKK